MIGSIASKLDPAEQRQQCDSNARATAGKRHDIAAVQCGEARIAQDSRSDIDPKNKSTTPVIRLLFRLRIQPPLIATFRSRSADGLESLHKLHNKRALARLRAIGR